MRQLLNMQIKIGAVWALVLILGTTGMEQWLGRCTSYVAMALAISVVAFIAQRRADRAPN